MLPVAILAYQRPGEIKKIIEKSVTNKIYVSLDFPNLFLGAIKSMKSPTTSMVKLNEMYKNYYEIIKNVEELQSSIKDKEIILLKQSNKNLGIYSHAFKLFELVFEKENDIIIFDDDIIPSKAFFYYANELYKHGLPITGFTESYSASFNGTFTKCMVNQIWGLVFNKVFYEGLKEFCNFIKDDNNFKDSLKLFLEKSDSNNIDRWNKIDPNWAGSGRLHNYMDLYINMFCVINDINFIKPTVSLVSPSDNHYKYFPYEYKEVVNYTKNITLI